MKLSLQRSVLITSSAWLLLCGCGSSGPPLADVEGTVTLNGKPLEGALLEFQPQGMGSPSYGSTDAQGHYELLYTQEKTGAMIGSHLVRITTLNENERILERLPPEYHRDSEITKEVVAGETNVIDFDLEVD